MAGNFDKLHEEELIMILKLVKNKKALYSTCNRLYELCLQIDNTTKIYELHISCPVTFKERAESIINSNRIISSVVIEKINERGLITSVLENIGSTVKKFSMIGGSMYCLSIYLNLLPNIETLLLYNLDYEDLPDLESLSLKNLRDMEINNCDHRITQVLDAFPDNVLEKLKVTSAISPLELFIMNQRNLKVLNITSNPESFDLIHLKGLKLDSFETDIPENLETFLESQHKLHKLTLCEMYISDIAFHFISQLKLLCYLKIDVEGTSRSAFSGIKELKNLKLLNIMDMDRADYKGHVMELNHIKNDNLNTLIIQLPYQEVPTFEFLGLAKSFKNLSTIDITLKNVTNEHIHPFITTVQSMIVKYWLDFMEDDFYGDFNYFNINESNLQLKSLNLRGMKLKFEDLPLVITNFPNLLSIALRFDGYVRDEHIEQMLIGMPKLKLLTVSRCCRLTIKVVDIIKEHGKHLEKVSMAGIEDFTKLEFDEAFRYHPQDINFS